MYVRGMSVRTAWHFQGQFRWHANADPMACQSYICPPCQSFNGAVIQRLLIRHDPRRSPLTLYSCMIIQSHCAMTSLASPTIMLQMSMPWHCPMCATAMADPCVHCISCRPYLIGSSALHWAVPASSIGARIIFGMNQMPWHR